MLDIVVPHHGAQTGFLADSDDSYAAAMETILALPAADWRCAATRGSPSSDSPTTSLSPASCPPQSR